VLPLDKNKPSVFLKLSLLLKILNEKEFFKRSLWRQKPVFIEKRRQSWFWSEGEYHFGICRYFLFAEKI